MNKRIKILILVAVLSFSAAFVVGCRNDAPPVTYTINYDLSYEIDGDTLWSTVNGETSVAPKTISEGSTFLDKLPQLDSRHDDYEFSGWYFISDESKIRVTEPTVFNTTTFKGIQNNNLTLTAVVRLKSECVIVNFDLSYEIDGKKVLTSVNGKTEVGTTVISEGEVFGDLLPVPDERNDEYLFIGWYNVTDDKETAVTSSTVFYADNFEVNEFTDYREITLCAKVDKKYIVKYKLSYEIDDETLWSAVNGENTVADGKIAEGLTFAGLIPEVDPRNDEYEFIGWYFLAGNTNIRVTETTEFNKQLFSDLENEIILLTAVVRLKSDLVFVNFDLSYDVGGTKVLSTVGGETSVEKAIVGEGLSFGDIFPVPDARDDEYLFVGWYYVTDGDETKITSSTVFDSNNFDIMDMTDYKEIVLYAKVVKAVVVRFDLSYELSGKTIWSTVNGEMTVPEGKITDGYSFDGILPQLDRRTDGYEFVGWYYITGDNRIQVTSKTVYESTVFNSLINNSITLIAVLSDENVTVKFDLAYEIDGKIILSTVGGNSEVPNSKISDGDSFGNILPTLDKRGDEYYLEGWYFISDNARVKVTNSTVFDRNMFPDMEDNIIILHVVLNKASVMVKFDLSYEIGGKTVWSTVNGETSVPDVGIGEGMSFGSILPELDKRSLEDDYYFMGWYYVYSGGQTKIEENTVFHKADFIGLEGNTITLVAKLGKAWAGPY